MGLTRKGVELYEVESRELSVRPFSASSENFEEVTVAPPSIEEIINGQVDKVRRSPLKNGSYGDQERYITAFFVVVYVVLVCSILFCITMGIIRCIR